ncbi:unnamed protein product [Auanema sp. JU1783]|nr:unnamed protein product [Auanema sp. JU1783]
MILPGETYPAIDIFKLIKFLIYKAENKQISIGDFVIIDVNDKPEYDKEHIISAQHYDRRLLSRNHFDTDTIAQGRNGGKALIIYGIGSGSTTAALIQRGYNAIQLQGSTSLFKEVLPNGFLFPRHEHFDVQALKSVLEKKRNEPRGERLWRSTSATRLKSSQDQSRIRQSTPKPVRIPWR